MSDDKNLNFFNYGIVAVGEDNKVVHFCGYEEKPQKIHYDKLMEELKTDNEFDYLPKEFKLREATEKEKNSFKYIYENDISEEDKEKVETFEYGIVVVDSDKNIRSLLDMNINQSKVIMMISKHA